MNPFYWFYFNLQCVMHRKVNKKEERKYSKLKHAKLKASKLKKVFQMTEKQSTLKAIKARVGKQSKRNLSKQSLSEMTRICGLFEEFKWCRSIAIQSKQSKHGSEVNTLTYWKRQTNS